MEDTTTDRSNRTRRFLTELAVIVMGVLIALGVEASWGRMQDRTREAELLVDLREEFAENEARLQIDIEFNEAVSATLDTWLAIVAGGVHVPIDSTEALLDGSLYLRRFDPLTGVLGSIIETGELALIQDAGLRHALSGWEGKVEEAKITTLDVQAYRAAVMPELFDVVHGPPDPARHETAIRSVTIFSAIVSRQQKELLIEVGRIRQLLESGGSR